MLKKAGYFFGYFFLDISREFEENIGVTRADVVDHVDDEGSHTHVVYGQLHNRLVHTSAHYYAVLCNCELLFCSTILLCGQAAV